MDSDGDGIGDFAGLAERIDYLAGSGVTCLWLMPFYPTPEPRRRLRHHRLLRRRPAARRRSATSSSWSAHASDRGMRVIIDLVVNHTSDEHPWFQAARARPRLAVPRLLRLARRAPPTPQERRLPRPENSELGARRGPAQYYLHRFYPFQPDLNIANPPCATRSPRSWASGSSSASRASASTPCRSSIEDVGRRRRRTGRATRTSYLRDLRAFVVRRRGDAILLGEVNVAPDERE